MSSRPTGSGAVKAGGMRISKGKKSKAAVRRAAAAAAERKHRYVRGPATNILLDKNNLNMNMNVLAVHSSAEKKLAEMSLHLAKLQSRVISQKAKPHIPLGQKKEGSTGILQQSRWVCTWQNGPSNIRATPGGDKVGQSQAGDIIEELEQKDGWIRHTKGWSMVASGPHVMWMKLLMPSTRWVCVWRNGPSNILATPGGDKVGQSQAGDVVVELEQKDGCIRHIMGWSMIASGPHIMWMKLSTAPLHPPAPPEFVEKENMFKALLGVVEDIYHVSMDQLKQLDSVRAFRFAIENDSTGAKDNDWALAMAMPGKVKDATDRLWIIAGGDEKNKHMSLVHFKALITLVLSKFNPEMYKQLIERTNQLYPDEDDMPDAMEAMYCNWQQNKDPPDSEFLPECLNRMTDGMGDRIGKGDFITLLAKHVVAVELLPPSWQSVKQVIAEANKTAE